MVMVGPETPVVDAAKTMKDKHVGFLMVVDKGKLVGVLTDRDIAVRVVAPKRDLGITRVRDVMTPEPISVREDTGIYEALKEMADHGIRRLPVVGADGGLTGIITLDDVLKILSKEIAKVGSAIHWEEQKEKGKKKLAHMRDPRGEKSHHG
jgi:CBS domain-containing protein